MLTAVAAGCGALTHGATLLRDGSCAQRSCTVGRDDQLLYKVLPRCPEKKSDYHTSSRPESAAK